MKRLILLIQISMSVCIAAKPVHAADTVTVDIPKAAVVAAFNSVLQDTRIRFDNYRGKKPKKEKSGNKANVSWLAQESYIRLPDGKTYKFDIPEHDTQVGNLKRYLRHYINDFNSQSVSVSANGDGLDVTLHFESQGREIKGKCIVWRPGKKKWVTCKNKKPDRDMQLDNAWVRLHLVPEAYKGGIAFKPLNTDSVEIKADLKVLANICTTVAQKTCRAIGNKLFQRLQEKARQHIVTAFNNNALRSQIAGLVKASLNELGKDWSITKLVSQGGKFVVTAQTGEAHAKTPKKVPVPVLPAIQSVQLSAQPSQFNGFCPAKVVFKGKLSVHKPGQYKYRFIRHDGKKKSGNYQLSFLNPGTKATVDWSTVVKRPGGLNKLAGQTDNKPYVEEGRYWLEVEGPDGKKKRDKADYKVTCQMPIKKSVIGPLPGTGKDSRPALRMPKPQSNAQARHPGTVPAKTQGIVRPQPPATRQPLQRNPGFDKVPSDKPRETVIVRPMSQQDKSTESGQPGSPVRLAPVEPLQRAQ